MISFVVWYYISADFLYLKRVLNGCILLTFQIDISLSRIRVLFPFILDINSFFEMLKTVLNF